jgi:RHS repeat-associated protein
VYAIHSNHLGVPQLVTDSRQRIVWQAKSTAFGDARISVQEITLNLRFPGQYFDRETGTHYNYYRDYDPQTGRYFQSDPIGLGGGMNTFAYVGGNPLSFVDPTGELAVVSRSGTTITVTVPVYFVPHVTDKNTRDRWAKDVTQIWNRGHWKTGKCDINVVPDFHADFRKGDNIGYVDPKNGLKREVVGGFTGRYMWLNSNTKSDVVAHEVGHLMNVGDHYTDDKYGYSHANPGWEHDIMGKRGMPVSSKAVDELIKKQKLDCECVR